MSEPKVSVEFRITGYGSADINLRVGDDSFLIRGASCTTDALGDLLRMALAIATGTETATASFDGEPMEWRLWAHNLGGSKGLFLKVLTFADIYKKEPDEAGDIVYSAECGAADFANAVLAAGQQVWATHGEKYEWLDVPFPMRALRALETATVTTDPPVPAKHHLEGDVGWTIYAPEKK